MNHPRGGSSPREAAEISSFDRGVAGDRGSLGVMSRPSPEEPIHGSGVTPAENRPPKSGSGGAAALDRDRMARLYRHLSRRAGGDRELAEDATQEACLRAVRHWRKAVPRDPDAWLRVTGERLLANYFRRHRPESLEGISEAAEGRNTEPAGPERSVELEEALGRLRPAARALVEAHHFGGVSLRELAAREGLSERAVEGRLHRARKRLQRHLGPDALGDAAPPNAR